MEDVEVDVCRKRIRHLYIRVGPPDGRVRVSAPLRIDDESVREAVVRRMSWIRRQREKHQNRSPEPQHRFVSGEQHFVDGSGVTLNVTTYDGPPTVYLLGESSLEMRVRPGAGLGERRELVERWYRERLRSRIPGIIAAWEPVMGVEVEEWRIRKMKTRWGTCNCRARRIWLNLELSRRPLRCLEYVIVHEMAHLIEPSHNRRFWGILDRLMPDWPTYRAELNRFPVTGQTE